jgi:hypothetical protein
MTDLVDRCDATASGTEKADFTWIKVTDEDAMLPLELAFCAHHNAEFCKSLQADGWTPFSFSETETAEPVSASI